MKKNITKAMFAAFAGLVLAAGCVSEQAFEEITSITLSRCLEPQNLSAKVDATTGDYVTFGWDVGKDADAYALEIYTDSVMTEENLYEDLVLLASEVPYIERLTADQKYWYRVRAYRLEEAADEESEAVADESTYSNWAVYDGSFKTYAVKDNLYLEITSIASGSISLAWSNEVDDYTEVTHISATPVKGGKTVKYTLNSAEATAAAATVTGLAASTEYQVVLYYMSASRGAVDAWTKADAGTMTVISTSDELKAAVLAGGSYYLSYSGSPYTMSGAKPAASLTLVGETAEDGTLPVVTGYFDISSTLADGSSLYVENVNFADSGSNSYLVSFSDASATVSLNSIEFVNCEVSGYKCGVFSANKTGVLKLSTGITFDSCYIHDILGSGGDFFDIRQNCEISTVKFVNNTITDGARTFFRIDAKESIIIGLIDFENNTLKGVSVMNDSNNQGLFALKVQTTMTLKKNLFLCEDGGETDESVTDKTQLLRDNTAVLEPTWVAVGDNYSYASGKDFYKRLSAATVGAVELKLDPCYNSKGGYLQLSNQDLIDAQVGASKWWISYVEKEEDLTQNVLDGAHTWNLQDASLFSGEVKNSRVRDELRLVGTEATPMNADGGINFLSASELTKKGIPTEGFISFKVNTAGSVDILVEDGGASSLVVALYDDNGYAVQGGVMTPSDGLVQKVVLSKVEGEGTVYIYATGAISLTKLAWSLDTTAGNRVLSTPALTVEPVTLTEGDETAVTVTWDAVTNAASYVVVFNKRAQDAQTETSFTVAAEDIAALKAGLYTFTVTAYPAEDDIYYTKSGAGSASIAVQPKASAGGETVEVDLVWDFSQADWQEQFAAYGAVNTDITNWDLTYDGLTIHSGSKSKYNTTFFQFGGKSGDMDRYFKFTAPEQGTLKITSSNTGSSEAADRTVAVTVGDDTQTQVGGAPSTSPVTLEYSVAAGEVIITAPVNGLRFYKIEFHYSYTTGGGSAPIEYDWDFSAADWQEALAALGAVNTDITNIDLTVEGLTFHSGSKSKYNTTYIQFGGKSGDMDRYFKFTAPEQGTLKVTSSNTGSAEAMDRTVAVTVGDDTQAQAGGFGKATPGELEFSVPAGEVVITAPENGLCFYKIYYTNQ